MTNAEKVILIEMALREAGIEMTIDGCGCCDSPWVTFKHGDNEFLVEGTRVDTSSKKTLKQVRAEQAEKRDLEESLKAIDQERRDAWVKAEDEYRAARESIHVTTDQKEAEAAQERLKAAKLKLRIAELNL